MHRYITHCHLYFVNIHVHVHVHNNTGNVTSVVIIFVCFRWAVYAGIESETNAYIVDYVVYVSMAVVFAGLAGLFVTTLAPYAAGSGIPEVSGVQRSVGFRGQWGYRGSEFRGQWGCIQSQFKGHMSSKEGEPVQLTFSCTLYSSLLL